MLFLTIKKSPHPAGFFLGSKQVVIGCLNTLECSRLATHSHE